MSRSLRPSSPGCARRCGVPRARRPSAPGGRCPDCHISRAQDTGLRQRAIHILWYVAEQHRGGTGAQSGLQTLLEHNSCRQLMLHQRLVLALSDSCDASAGAAAPDHPTQSTTAALASTRQGLQLLRRVLQNTAVPELQAALVPYTHECLSIDAYFQQDSNAAALQATPAQWNELREASRELAALLARAIE